MARKSGFVSRKRAPVGAPPGTLIPDVAASPTTVRVTVITDEGLEKIESASIAVIEKAMKGANRLWVDVTGLADIALLRDIAGLFKINELALEDIINANQRPKVDNYGDQALVIVHMMDGQPFAAKEQFAIFFDRRHVVTFQERPGDCLDPVRKRLANSQGQMRRRGPAYLVYAIIDTILDAYFPLLEDIGDQLEILEDAISSDPQPENITRLHDLKRMLLVIKRALWPSREMLSVLTRQDLDLVPAEVNQYLRDTYDHSVQLIEIVETYRELASGLLDLYLSSVSTRMNEVMKILTIVATIFIPLTFLAGVWGMNFDPDTSPWNMPELRWYLGYPFALGLMLFVGVSLLFYFRWRRWM